MLKLAPFFIYIGFQRKTMIRFNDITMALRMLIAAMTAAVCFLSLIAATSIADEKIPPVIKVHMRDGLLTLNATNAPLADVLIEIGKSAGIRTVLKGGLKSPVSISVTDIPLTDGIRRLLGNRSVAFIHNSADESDVQEAEPAPSAIWVFETEGSKRSTTIQKYQSEGTENDINSSIAREQMQAKPPQSFRRVGVNIASQIDDSDEIGYLSLLLSKKQDRYAREQAIAGLARIGSDSAVAAMATALGDSDQAIRLQVVEGLGQVGNEVATRILGQALFGDPNPEIRLEAVRALAKLGSEISHAFIIAATNDSDKRVHRSAQQMLEKW